MLGIHLLILINQFTLSQPRWVDYAHHLPTMYWHPRIFKPSYAPEWTAQTIALTKLSLLSEKKLGLGHNPF